MNAENKNIERFLSSGTFEIDINFGIQELNKYLHDLYLLENNVPFKDLGFSEKRENQKAYIFNSYERYNISDTDIPKGSLGHLRLNGVMRMEDGLSSNGVRTLANELTQLENNPNVSGVILEINSGGGESLAGNYLHSIIKDFSKPVAVWGHFVGSAALNAAVAADKVYLSSKGAEMGSIGTMVTIDKQYLKEYKEYYKEVYSSLSPDKNKDWRELLDGKENTLIKSIDKNASAFQDNVKTSRSINPDLEESTLKGAMFIAEDAIERGLSDGIKSFKEVVNELQTLTNNSKTKIQTDNFKTMDFKQSFNSLISSLNSFFNWSYTEESNVEDVKQSLSDLGTSFKDAVNSEVTKAVSALNTQFSEMRTKFETQDAFISELKTEIAELKGNTTVSDDISEMKATISKLQLEKTDLEKQIISLKNAETDTNSNTGFGINSTASSFMDAIGNVVIEGESKY